MNVSISLLVNVYTCQKFLDIITLKGCKIINAIANYHDYSYDLNTSKQL